MLPVTRWAMGRPSERFEVNYRNGEIYYRNNNGSDSTVSELFDLLQQDTQAYNYSLMFRLRQDGTNSDLKFWGLISNFTMTCSVGEVVSARSRLSLTGSRKSKISDSWLFTWGQPGRSG